MYVRTRVEMLDFYSKVEPIKNTRILFSVIPTSFAFCTGDAALRVQHHGQGFIAFIPKSANTSWVGLLSTQNKRGGKGGGRRF